jgi:hypothetical protein
VTEAVKLEPHRPRQLGRDRALLVGQNWKGSKHKHKAPHSTHRTVPGPGRGAPLAVTHTPHLGSLSLNLRTHRIATLTAVLEKIPFLLLPNLRLTIAQNSPHRLCSPCRFSVRLRLFDYSTVPSIAIPGAKFNLNLHTVTASLVLVLSARTLPIQTCPLLSLRLPRSTASHSSHQPTGSPLTPRSEAATATAENSLSRIHYQLMLMQLTGGASASKP